MHTAEFVIVINSFDLLLIAYMSMQYAMYYRIEYAFELKRKCILQN